MKKYICYSLLLLLSAVAFQACKHDSLMLFDQKPDAYFAWHDGTDRALDTTRVRFAYLTSSEMTMIIPVKITGALSDADRSVSFTVVNDKTTAVAGQHYELLSESITIPANKTEGFLPVRVIRENLSAPGTGILRLSLRLEPNETFGTNYREKLDLTTGESRQVLEHCIEMSDIIVKPKYWVPPGYPANLEPPIFGAYSPKKFMLICEVNGYPPSFLDGYEYINEAGDKLTMTNVNYMGITITMAKRTQVYLNQQKALGNTIYEDKEDGTPDTATEMKMGYMGGGPR